MLQLLLPLRNMEMGLVVRIVCDVMESSINRYRLLITSAEVTQDRWLREQRAAETHGNESNNRMLAWRGVERGDVDEAEYLSYYRHETAAAGRAQASRENKYKQGGRLLPRS